VKTKKEKDNEPSWMAQLSLAMILKRIQENDVNYPVRYNLVMQALAKAGAVGLKAGFRNDPEHPEWPVAYIELPTGQVSWHMPQHEIEWDGHDTVEKYKRIDDYSQIAMKWSGATTKK
jgi:hypothetical protein